MPNQIKASLIFWSTLLSLLVHIAIFSLFTITLPQKNFEIPPQLAFLGSILTHSSLVESIQIPQIAKENSLQSQRTTDSSGSQQEIRIQEIPIKNPTNKGSLDKPHNVRAEEDVSAQKHFLKTHFLEEKTQNKSEATQDSEFSENLLKSLGIEKDTEYKPLRMQGRP